MTSRDKPRQERSRPDRRRPAGDARRSVKESAEGAASAESSQAEPERISKLLARAGVASRRDVERMIMAGRVKVNGTVLETPAVNVTLADRIEVDDTVVDGIERTRLWLYYKPAGLVTTNRDPEGRQTIFEKLPNALPRVMTVGRLDINTEGLLLLTNDGGLARVLELPSTGWLRRYRVRAHGDIDQERLDRLKDGIAVEGVLYGAIEATLDRKQGANVWITMGLREGKNREIKNVLGALGLDVNRLIRLSYGPFQLADLAEGEVREVRGRTLRDQLGPRLIEEAGADFDAPINNRQEETKGSAEKPDREQRIRPAREKPAERNERLRGRLDTRREDHVKAGEQDKGKKKPAGIQRRRASNVWIAPGARPMGPKKTAERAEAEARQAAKDERQRQRREGVRSSAPDRAGKADGFGPRKTGPGKPGTPKSAAKPKPAGGKRTAPGRPTDKVRGESRTGDKAGGRPGRGRDGKAGGRPGRGRDGKAGGRPGRGRDGADRRR